MSRNIAAMLPRSPRALRIDDIGASSKHHLYYAKRRFANLGPLRDRRLFGHWAPYREMTALDWDQIFVLLRRYRAVLTVGVTATWVEDDGSLVPFPEKFPGEAAALRDGVARGLIEIANHGLTHCVLDQQQFRRRPWFGTNQRFHREFWDWIPAETQLANLRRAQAILTDYFQVAITTLVPPGNVYSAATLAACREVGLRTVNCQAPQLVDGDAPRVIGDDDVLAFHDRELVEEGPRWLERRLRTMATPPQLFIRDL